MVENCCIIQKLFAWQCQTFGLEVHLIFLNFGREIMCSVIVQKWGHFHKKVIMFCWGHFNSEQHFKCHPLLQYYIKSGRNKRDLHIVYIYTTFRSHTYAFAHSYLLCFKNKVSLEAFSLSISKEKVTGHFARIFIFVWQKMVL